MIAAAEIPRALSWSRGSPHYREEWLGRGAEFDVLLDGSPVRDVVTYDCDSGLVVRHARNAEGKKYLAPDGEGAAIDTLRGVVTVRPRLVQRPVYGSPPRPRFGGVVSGIMFNSHAQARLLERLLVAALRDQSGRDEETLLAKWHREVVSARRRARRDRWWDDE